jgi:hypothetical protein
VIDKAYEASPLSVHYGADEQMIDDIFGHLKDGRPLPVSILDGLEAGLTAIKLDEARAQKRVIELTDTWARFDAFGLGTERAA